jgi:Zn-dependent protease with chaperone function
MVVAGPMCHASPATMRYEQLLALVALTAFAAASTVACACVAATFQRVETALATRRSISRARALLLVRLTPVLAGTLACVLAMLAYLRHEPRTTEEIPGWLLIAGAVAGACLVVAGGRRAIERCWRTSRFLRLIDQAATPVIVPGATLPAWQADVEFPLLAVAGFWRPRLLIARQVLVQLPEDELAVAVQHEIAHARRRDNLSRLLFTALPDVLGLIEGRLGLARAWHEAVEDAADDFATQHEPEARLRLASALVRVASLAGDRPMPPVPLTAFHEGGSTERRVRRLVGEAARPAPAALLPWRVAMAVSFGAASVVALTWNRALRAVHDAIEWLVNAGPAVLF